MLGLTEVQSKEDLKEYLSHWRIMCLVIDALPETRVAEEICSWYPGRGFRSYYTDRDKSNVRWDEVSGTVTVHRTHSLDTLFSIFRARKAVLPRRTKEVEKYAAHFEALKRKREEDEETGDVRFAYVKVGADHYAHSSNLGLVALGRFEERNLEGSVYRLLGRQHLLGAFSFADIDGPASVFCCVVPDVVLPWVIVWAVADVAGLVIFFREMEFTPISPAMAVRRMKSAQVSDPSNPVEVFFPARFASANKADPVEEEKSLAYGLEREGLSLTTVDVPQELAVMSVREYLSPRPGGGGIPGCFFAETVPNCLEAVRLFRPVASERTSEEARLLSFHEAVATILSQHPRHTHRRKK